MKYVNDNFGAWYEDLVDVVVGDKSLTDLGKELLYEEGMKQLTNYTNIVSQKAKAGLNAANSAKSQYQILQTTQDANTAKMAVDKIKSYVSTYKNELKNAKTNLGATESALNSVLKYSDLPQTVKDIANNSIAAARKSYQNIANAENSVIAMQTQAEQFYTSKFGFSLSMPSSFTPDAFTSSLPSSMQQYAPYIFIGGGLLVLSISASLIIKAVKK